MKKILFISVRNPFSGRFSGDVIRSLKIINLLKKKYKLDVVCLKNENSKMNEKSTITFNYPNKFLKIFYCLVSFLKFQPLQFGLFYSNKMKIFLENNANNYDYLFFYHIRSSQYLPKNYNGKTIIEMGDLYSDNYIQTFKYLNYLNPFKYIYYLESLLVKKLENKIFLNFDKIILFSKNEINKIDKKFKKKIYHIEESVEKIKSKYLYSKKNFKILFIGNLNYLPNFLACKDFIKQIMPKLNLKLPDIKFCIIGNISKINKMLLPKNINVEILGQKKSLSPYIKNTFCGLANLKIATGVQGKVLTYMSYGLPVVCSTRVSNNFGSNVLSYKSSSELVEKIILLKQDITKSKILSKKSLKYSRNLNWKSVSLKYLKLINF